MKYGHITLKFVGKYFIWVVPIFSKNMSILVQKLGTEKNCQNPFPAILKSSMATKPEGVGWWGVRQLREELFLRLPLAKVFFGSLKLTILSVWRGSAVIFVKRGAEPSSNLTNSTYKPS